MHKIVEDHAWLKARLALLEEEKDLQKARDSLAEKRRALPWRKITTDYRFDTEDGEKSLADLFGECAQLIVYHFMYGSDWKEGCKSCSFWADNYNGVVPHLRARDTKLIAVSLGPLEQLLAFRERMGWSFPWVSAGNSSFNQDFDVSFSREQIDSGEANYNYHKTQGIGEEMPGLSAFRREDGVVFHTYSTYARGLDPFNTAYQLLDLTSLGRNEGELDYPMDWLRRRDEY